MERIQRRKKDKEIMDERKRSSDRKRKRHRERGGQTEIDIENMFRQC